MNINLIINIAMYFVLFSSLITGFLIGLKRGLRKSAIRIGVLSAFLIVAGLITPSISSALININLSSFNLKIGGTIVTTIPQLIQTSLNSITGYQSVVDAVPSIVGFIEQLPIALLNIIVFLLLVLIMKFISWIAYMIIARFALKEIKIEKALKRQKKLEKKGKTADKQLVSTTPKALPTPLPPKRRLWGAALGVVQAFVIMFLLFIPFTSIFGIINETSTNVQNIENSYTIYADENDESLYEFSNDLIKNTIGENVFSYFNTFNNSIPTKVLSLGGLNNVIFDSLINIKVNEQNIYLRKEVVTATKIYDNYILALDEMGKEEYLSDFNFNIVRSLANLALNSNIVNAFGEELFTYAAEQLQTLDNNTIPYFSDIRESVDLLLDLYKKDPKDFMVSFKKDVNHLLNIAEVVLTSGIVDDSLLRPLSINLILDDIKDNNFKVLNTFVNEGYSSYIIKVVTSKGLNIVLDLASSKLSSDSFTADLGKTDYLKINWEETKPSVYNIIKNLIDIYDVINLYDVNAFINNPISLIEDIENQDAQKFISLLGKEMDLIKDSPLFNEQKNPTIGIIEWMDNNSTANKFIDAQVMITVSSWQLELEPFAQSFIGFKDSGVFDLLLEKPLSIDTIVNALLEPVSTDLNSPTFIKQILSPILNSDISKGLVVYILNQANNLLGESIPSMSLTEFSKETFPTDQNEEILEIIENVLSCFSIFDGQEEIDIATIPTEKLAKLLTALQYNTFRKNTPNPINYNVDFENKTVVNGGLFSNYYISFVTYIFGETQDINYKNVNWSKFLKSSQDLYSNLENLGEGSSIQDLFNLGEEDSKEMLEDLLEAIGLDSSIAEDLINLNNAIQELSNPESELSNEEIYDIIDNSLTNLLESEDADGKNTIETLIDIVQSITGEEIPEDISLSTIEKERLVSNRLKLLVLNSENPIDASDTTPDTIYSNLNLLDATIQDLTCGATYVLQNSNKTIYVSSIDISTLTSKIEAATTDSNIVSLVLNMFQIIE